MAAGESAGYVDFEADGAQQGARSKMQVLCKSTSGNAETHCCVCGQGFVLFWERQSRSERIEAIRDIQHTLRNHHRNDKGPDAHPNENFLVPEWSGANAGSGAANQVETASWAR
jgi:hypothetical protein